ncbi:MAG: hypothetical protein HC767_06460, partial [Akkermansiaceae bacterium]|nr:hypothetical protein [Akkermansiaceae bacterium]
SSLLQQCRTAPCSGNTDECAQVTNLHIRYEDGVTQKGHPFAVGLTLHSIGAFTVDERNTEVLSRRLP